MNQKRRSNLEPRVEDSLSRLQTLFEAEMISKNLNTLAIIEIKLLYKESDYREEIDVMKK